MINLNPRITSGDFKNRKLKLPNFSDLRIVKDKVRQAIFNLIGDRVKSAKVADVFAGSGSLGFECLSRGAGSVEFIDENYSCIRTITENAKILGVLDKIYTQHTKAIGFLGNTQDKFDLIFLDPFYKDTKHKFLLKLAEEALNPEGLIIFLHREINIKDLILNINLDIIEERNYGQTYLTILKKKS